MSPTGRAAWHRPTGLIPVAYLVAIVAVSAAHTVVPDQVWLLVHLLFLGAATNAIVVWGAHFAAAILRPPVEGRPGAAVRLAVLNTGVLAVLVGGVVGPAWLGVAGASVVFAAIAAHAWVLATWLRRSLPARFAVVVRYYLWAATALLLGIPAGAWMLVVDDAQRSRVLLFHAHVNLLGWITLTVLGTLLTLWPTVLRTRMADQAPAAARRALPLSVAGLAALGVGTLAWWPLVAAAGLLAFAAAVIVVAAPAVATARRQPLASFAAWSIAAAIGWLLVALGWDAVTLLSAPDPATAVDRFGAVVVPLAVGFVAQVLIGSLSFLLPMVLGGGPGPVKERLARLDAHWAQRVAMGNAGLAVYLLPVPAMVRIAVSLVVLVALGQFLVAAVRILFVPMESTSDGARPRQAGVAAGLAIVLLAVLAGVVAERSATPAAETVSTVRATGHTTTVAVTATGMRYEPSHIMVPTGDRLVIRLTNADTRKHDLVLATGARTGLLGAGETAELDAGVIGGTVQGWCSQPMHRQSGMTLTIMGTGTAPSDSTVDAMRDPGPAFTARDATLPPAEPGQVHRITLHAREVKEDIAAGVSRTLWTFDGTAPGPVLRGRIGDVFEITLANDASVEHGIDFHAEALAPDTAMRTVEPGQSVVYRFTATKAGIWMYHCSAMPMLPHIANGMYGAVVIDPPDLAPVDREYLLVQSEFYPADGPYDTPDAMAFNGFVSQYAFRPLAARTGERVRIWVLDAGPNHPSAFHLVGAPFDTVYLEGSYRLRPTDAGGAQVLDLAPASGGFVEAVLPQPGTYPFLTHAMSDADLGARGAIRAAP